VYTRLSHLRGGFLPLSWLHSPLPSFVSSFFFFSDSSFISQLAFPLVVWLHSLLPSFISPYFIFLVFLFFGFISQLAANIRSYAGVPRQLTPVGAARLAETFLRKHGSKLAGAYPCMNSGYTTE